MCSLVQLVPPTLLATWGATEGATHGASGEALNEALEGALEGASLPDEILCPETKGVDAKGPAGSVLDVDCRTHTLRPLPEVGFVSLWMNSGTPSWKP